MTGSDAARNRALADAAAGVVGSLVSTLAFYPVDVWKTSLQAGVSSSSAAADGCGGGPASGDEDGNAAGSSTSNGISGGRQLPLSPSAQAALSKLFRGLPHKIIHTVVSSFTYFYVYSLVQTRHAARRSPRQRQHGRNAPPKTSTATKLLLTAFAAVINTGITLPLDTISSRKQAGTGGAVRGGGAAPIEGGGNEREATDAGAEEDGGAAGPVRGRARSDDGSAADDDSSFGEYHSANEEDGGGNGEGADCEEDAGARGRRDGAAPSFDETRSLPKNGQSLYIKSPEKYRFSFSANLAEEAFATANTASNNSGTIDSDGNNRHCKQQNQQQQQEKLKSILSLWNGLFPAILLCTNPAIQYTMFDTLKGALFDHRSNSMQRNPGRERPEQQPASSEKLSMWEAFAFGLVSKFFATVVTYPLIRCKVMLMVSPPEAFDGGGDGDGAAPAPKDGAGRGAASGSGRTGEGPARRPAPFAPKKYPRSLPLLLVHIFRNDGLRGIYKGCSLQLLHTILKSALLMMVRERITAASHAFFQVEGS